MATRAAASSDAPPPPPAAAALSARSSAATAAGSAEPAAAAAAARLALAAAALLGVYPMGGPCLPPALPGFTVKNCADVEGNEGGVTRGSDTVLEAPAAVTAAMSPSPEAPADISALALVASAPARTGEDIGGKIQVSRRAVASGPTLPPPSPPPFRIPCFDMVPTKVCCACG